MSQTKSDGMLFVLIISLACISISLVQTAIGYEPLFGSIVTWVVSGIISLFMLRTNFQLRKFLQEGKGVIGILLFYMVIATVSFIGNFNAFYSRFMQEELYDRELREYQEAIPALATESTVALGNTNNYEELERKVKQLTISLKAQITNPGDPGMGKKARAVAAEIEKNLGTKLTKLNGTPRAMATGMENQINDILAQMKTSMNQDVTPIIQKIQTRSAEAENIINAALDPQRIKSDGRSALEKAVFTYNSICELTKGVISGYSCERRNPRNLEVGKLSHSFQSAFVEKQSGSATMIAVFASLLIDFLVPVYLFLTVKMGSGGVGASTNSPPIERGSIPNNDTFSKMRRGGRSGATEL